ncbi:MAG TPA: 3-hydroxybutyrate oligomer hydrolase family protein, partial [Burkholderiales bacterium]|nr:3-hydroxybutyrate oligomer hydrolase family protein [Burkholderiales bacterium]
KHAHSQRNPEKSWGRYTLETIEFAFFVLNQLADQRKGKYVPNNTLVIAASVSNGGYSSLLAAEQDKKGLIDAVVVAEPNASLSYNPGFSIRQGNRPSFTAHSKPLLDYITLINIYQPCASTTIANSSAPFNSVPIAFGASRCDALASLGLLKTQTAAERAAEAQDILNGYGVIPDSNLVHPSHYTFSVPQSIAVTYANAYGRFNVDDNLCGYSFGATIPAAKEGNPDDFGKPIPAVNVETIFTTSSGIPPTAGINLINNLSPGGPKEDRLSSSASTGKQDMNLDGALCIRSLVTGMDSVKGGPLTGERLEQHRRIQQGIRETQMSAHLHGLPVIIVTGRADAVLEPNHASRAYVGLNQLVEGQKSGVRYYEITNAHHLDAFNAFPGFDTRYIPLHHYYLHALNMMWSHLKNGSSLAPSQVVRTRPRGGIDGKAPPIEGGNLPAIQMSPAQDARIIFNRNVLDIPD